MVYEKEINYLKEKYNNLQLKLISSGAEAIILSDKNIVIKYRLPKYYRIKQIDESLRKFRTKREAKVIKSLKNIINSPELIEQNDFCIVMKYIDGEKISDMTNLSEEILKKIGINLAKIHQQGISHGDLTTSNMILLNNNLYFIDFGLSSYTTKVEDYAVDIHLLKRALESKHFQDYPNNYEIVLKTYIENYPKSKEVLKRLELVEKRGRYKHK